MASTEPCISNKKLHPAFNGLNDRQVAAIYQQDRVRQLQPGECLFSEGDLDPNLYLVIRGELQIQQYRRNMLSPVSEIQSPGFVPADYFSENGCRCATAIAREPLTVLVIDEDTLNAIDQDARSMMFQNLAREQSLEINQLLSARVDMQVKSRHMSQELNSMLLGKSGHYAGSGAIHSLLARVPKLPPYASQLTGLLLNEDASARDVTEIARLDPSLTSAVLKRVNSAYFGLNQKVTDFQHAALLLGFNQIYQVILDLGIQKTMPNTGQFRRLQSHSVLIAILSFEVSQVVNSGNGSVMNTIGLLHDIGKSVLLLLIAQNPKLAFFISLLDPDRVGALLLQNWEIPDAIYKPLEYQKYPELLPPEMVPDDCRNKVAILYLAHLCYDFMNGKPENKLPVCFLTDYFSLLGIKEQTVEGFIRKSLLKSAGKRLPTYPREVQDFFANAPGLIPGTPPSQLAEAAA